jgi:hypothetical protein
MGDTSGANMNGFEKREEDFEKKFAHDEELRFRAHARRNRMLGQWAAQKLGLAETAADNYATAMVAEFVNAPEAALFKKLRKDFDEKGVPQSDHQITRTMSELLAKAVIDINEGRS